MRSGSSSGSIAVVGTGVIGVSWAAYFLAKGFDVAASDPAEGAETRLQTLVDGFWPRSSKLVLPKAPRGVGCASTPISRALLRTVHSSRRTDRKGST